MNLLLFGPNEHDNRTESVWWLDATGIPRVQTGMISQPVWYGN